MTANISPNNSNNSDYERLSAKEFRVITKWAVGLVFAISKPDTVIYFITSTFSKILPLFWAYMFGRILDWVVSAAKTGTYAQEELINIFALMLAYGLIETLNSFFQSKSMMTLRHVGPPALREAYLRKLNKLGIQTLEQPEVNDKMHRANEYLGSLIDFYIQIIDIITEFIRFIVALIVILKGYPLLALLVILTKLPSIYVDKVMRTKMWKIHYENTEPRRLSGQSAGKVSQASDLAEVTIINGFNFLLNKYLTFQNWYVKVNLELQDRWRVLGHGLSVTSDVVTYSAYTYFFVQVIKGKITIGDVSFAVRSLGTLQSSFSTVARSLSQLMEKSLQYKDLHSLFILEPYFADGTVLMEKLMHGPEIEFKNVSFKYPNSEKYIFKNLNLSIRSGDEIAIVGHNGAGKTTLAKLITRFYQPTEGEILINGTNITEIKSESLYENYGVLWQDYNTYAHLTVKENIYLGDSTNAFDEARMLKAAEAADATSFINEYPNKFETILSEKIKGGIRPSTGQWQKIAIARFFYRNAPLIIFDEPTASIDAQSEYNIFKNIYDFFTGKTVIIISHRFSTVRNADRILVMDHGEIIEDGSHDELMALQGKYADAFKLQAEGYKENVTKIV